MLAKLSAHYVILILNRVNDLTQEKDDFSRTLQDCSSIPLLSF